MAKKIVSDLDLKGKTVLERADFNVPLLKMENYKRQPNCSSFTDN